jgi:hypothetical protein
MKRVLNDNTVDYLLRNHKKQMRCKSSNLRVIPWFQSATRTANIVHENNHSIFIIRNSHKHVEFFKNFLSIAPNTSMKQLNETVECLKHFNVATSNHISRKLKPLLTDDDITKLPSNFEVFLFDVSKPCFVIMEPSIVYCTTFAFKPHPITESVQITADEGFACMSINPQKLHKISVAEILKQLCNI